MDFTELANLTFGKSDAESETKKLQEYFVTTQAYINAKNEERRKTYYIGHRGAGKSALLNKLAYEFQKDNKSIIIEITPHDFSYERFKRKQHEYSDVRAVYAAVWHYTLITQLFKKTVDYFQERPFLKNNKENINKISKYLISKGVYDTENILEIFFNFLTEATYNKITNRLKNIESGLSNVDKELFRFLNLSEIRPEINALENISDGHPIYLFVDELDTGWDNSKESQNFIYGLFYSIREIQKLRNLNVFVSLRSDMYNDLSSLLPDPEKMRGNIERFYWNEKTLKWLISSRISSYASNKGIIINETDDPINIVFEAGALDYIISHSLHRPREIIEFCNETINEVGRLIYNTQNLPNKITLETVKAVEPLFSKNRFNDFCDEYKHQYPNLKYLLSCFEHSSEYYFFQEFKSKLEDSMLKTLEIGDELWIHNYLDNPKKLIEILFEIGFIKFYSQKDAKYLAYYESSFINIENIKQLKINDVFASALKCYGENK